MEPETISSATTSNANVPLEPVTLDVVTPLLEIISENNFFSLEGVLGFLNTAWTVYAILAYLFCIGLLVLFVYASTGQKQLNDLGSEERAERERIYEEHFKTGPRNDRMQDVMNHIASASPNDWKLAIIEADIILDEILQTAGYAGISLGERLKSISPTQLQSLDDAWEAHKIRNKIAHGGSDFVLTQKLAEDTINRYRRVFSEFGVR